MFVPKALCKPERTKKALVCLGCPRVLKQNPNTCSLLARQSALPATVHLRKKLVGLRDSMAAASKAAAVSEAEQSGRLQRFKNVIRPAVFLQVFNA
jgi:hypothetical protein